LVLSTDGAKKLAEDPGALEFVRDAFHHLKAIGYDQGGAELLRHAGVETDPGVVMLSNLKAFIRAAKTRQWGRE
jgi:catalase